MEKTEISGNKWKQVECVTLPRFRALISYRAVKVMAKQANEFLMAMVLAFRAPLSLINRCYCKQSTMTGFLLNRARVLLMRIL